MTAFAASAHLKKLTPKNMGEMAATAKAKTTSRRNHFMVSPLLHFVVDFFSLLRGELRSVGNHVYHHNDSNSDGDDCNNREGEHWAAPFKGLATNGSTDRGTWQGSYST